MIFFYRLVLAGLLLSGFGRASCKQAAGTEPKEAILTGFDQRACPCCGGLMMTLNGEPKPYVAPFYLIDNDPASLGIDAAATFPIRVSVEYEKLDKCAGTHVRIKKMVRR